MTHTEKDLRIKQLINDKEMIKDAYELETKKLRNENHELNGHYEKVKRELHAVRMTLLNEKSAHLKTHKQALNIVSSLTELIDSNDR